MCGPDTHRPEGVLDLLWIQKIVIHYVGVAAKPEFPGRRGRALSTMSSLQPQDHTPLGSYRLPYFGFIF